MERPADLVLLDGKIITVDPDDSIAEGMAIRDGRILAVGSNEAVQAWAGEGTRTLRLEVQSVMPGLIDAHTHLEGIAEFHRMLDVHVPPLEDVDAILDRVRERVAIAAPAEWIVGAGGWGQPLPTREQLDQVAPNHPVVLRESTHVQILNSEALRICGIRRDTEPPRGGAHLYRFGRRADGPDPVAISAESAWICLASETDGGAPTTVTATAEGGVTPSNELIEALNRRLATSEGSTALEGTAVAVALGDSGIMGSLGTSTPAGVDPDPDQQNLLVTLAHQLGVALENAQLYRERQESLRSYANQTIQAMEDERLRIARELHDDTAQELVYVVRRLEALGADADPALATSLDHLVDRTRQIVRSVRRF